MAIAKQSRFSFLGTLPISKPRSRLRSSRKLSLVHQCTPSLYQVYAAALPVLLAMFAMDGLPAIGQHNSETRSSRGKVSASHKTSPANSMADIKSWHQAGQAERARRRAKPQVLEAKSSVLGFSLDAGVASGTSSMTSNVRLRSAYTELVQG